MPTPTLGMQKNSLLPLNSKKTVRPPAAGVITNCAFMPTDADTVNIHVQVWMGPAEAWVRGTDGRFQPIYKKNAQDLLFTQTRAAGPTKTPLSLHQEKNNHSLILLSELSVWQRLTLQLYLKFRSDIVIVTLPGEWRGLCHMSTYKHKCRAMYKREKSTFYRRYWSRKLKTILLMCCGPAR